MAKQCWTEQKSPETVIFEKSEKFFGSESVRISQLNSSFTQEPVGWPAAFHLTNFIRDRHESVTPEQIAFKVTHWIIHFLPDILYIG